MARAVLVAGAVLGGLACTDDPPEPEPEAEPAPPPPDRLDVAELEDRIDEELADELDLDGTPTTVRCPGEIGVELGATFSCSVLLDGQRLTVTATQGGPGAPVRLQRDRAVVTTEMLADELSARITAQQGVGVVVDCGADQVRVVAPGTELACSATYPDDRARAVTVAVTDLAGSVEFRLDPVARPPAP